MGWSPNRRRILALTGAAGFLVTRSGFAAGFADVPNMCKVAYDPNGGFTPLRATACARCRTAGPSQRPGSPSSRAAVAQSATGRPTSAARATASRTSSTLLRVRSADGSRPT